MTYLVDTDWIVDYLKGVSRAERLLDELFAAGIAISIITYAEVLEGVYYGRDPESDERVFREFLEGIRIIAVNEPVAEQYARLAGELREQGLLVPAPDLFIAATAVAFDLVLATRNVRHYRRIPGLGLHSDTVPPSGTA